MGHVVDSGVSGAWNVGTLFFMLGWDRYGIDKNRIRTSYTKLVFLLPVGFVGHVAYSDTSGE
jgi:hypothetical protein